MSKAEESAMQHCCTNCTNNKLNCGMKLLSHGRDCIACSNYIEGYRQAEKDLELTWEDIAGILDVTDIIANDDSMEERLKTMSEEEYCKEVLKRYKEMK